MDKKVLDYAVEKTHDLMNAFSCSEEAKASAQAWLDAVGTDHEKEATRKYIADLDGDIVPIDMLIETAESERGVQIFGSAEQAKKVEAHAKEIKAAGAKHCDCPACSAAAAIVEKKAELLA